MSPVVANSSDRKLARVIDILGTVRSLNRLTLLLQISHGRITVGELTTQHMTIVNRSSTSQISNMLAPLRRMGLVEAVRDGRSIYYQITKLGWDLVQAVELIHGQL